MKLQEFHNNDFITLREITLNILLILYKKNNQLFTFFGPKNQIIKYKKAIFHKKTNPAKINILKNSKKITYSHFIKLRKIESNLTNTKFYMGILKKCLFIFLFKYFHFY